MNDDALEVFADGELVWQGELGPDALSFEGPVGMRTDNGRFELEFAVASSDALSGGEPAGCTKEPGAD
jgi:hypothetical protein